MGESAPRGFQIVRAVKVWIVDAGEPKFFAVAFDGGIFVKQDAQSGFLEMGNDFDDVVVAEAGQSPGSECGGDAADVSEAIVEISRRMIGKVSRDDGKVMRGARNEFDQAVGESFHAIEMKIGKMKETETVEGGRKVGQWLIANDSSNVEAVGPATCGESGETQQCVDHAIDWHNAFNNERAFSLVDKPGAQVGLTLQTLAKKRRPQARSERAEVDRVDIDIL